MADESVPADDDPFDRFLRDVLDEDSRTRVHLSDLEGFSPVAERLRAEVIAPLRTGRDGHPARAGSERGQVLLYGPPSVPLGLIARAAGNEPGIRSLSVGLSEILDMWVDDPQAQLHRLFARARSLAPCLLVLDEVDAVGARRDALASSGGRALTAQLVDELTSLSSSGPGAAEVRVVAATHAPWELDHELLDRRRFGPLVFVPPAQADLAPARDTGSRADEDWFAHVRRVAMFADPPDLYDEVTRWLRR